MRDPVLTAIVSLKYENRHYVAVNEAGVRLTVVLIHVPLLRIVNKVSLLTPEPLFLPHTMKLFESLEKSNPTI